MRFEKWQALGNDYLIVERDDLPFELTPSRVRRLCGAHFGVFADGVLELSRPRDPDRVADLRIFNPDGSEAELSGNGAREAIMYLHRRGWTDAREFSIQTIAGELRPRIEHALRQKGVRYELWGSSPARLRYEVTLPLHLKTQKLTRLIKKLNGHNGTNVEWNIKKFKTVQT